jgi:transmembrane sensor
MNELNDSDHRKIEEANRVAYLIAGYLANTLTEDEKDELDDWVIANDQNMQLFAQLTDEKNIQKGLKERGVYDTDKAVALLKQRILTATKKNHPIRIRLIAYTIAASVILALGILFLLPLLHRQPPTTAVAKMDLAPGSNKAILTLANGQQIVLDSNQGNIIQQDSLKVVNLNGKLSYEGSTSELQYHTLTTPKGGQYKIILPDGTAVWLNAGSSLKYPLAFTGGERRVELTGEGYFEAAKDRNKPFKIKLENGTIVEVLGTHFNIMAYNDEAQTAITLLEGRVKVTTQPDNSASEQSTVITPGEQARINNKNPSSVTVTRDIDTEEVTGWKNGLFEFKDQPIEVIMKQVARWYNVDVKYEGKVNEHFTASIERNVPVSKLFHYLELTDRVHFKIEDKTIIVKP